MREIRGSRRMSGGWVGSWVMSRRADSKGMAALRGSGFLSGGARQLQPAPGVPAALLDQPEPARDVVGQRDGLPAHLEPAHRRLGGRKDNARVENSEGVERALDAREQGHDLVTVDPGEQAGA